MADVAPPERPSDDQSGHTRSDALHALGSLLARQIDLICAAQLISIKVTLSVHNGGSVRAAPDEG
jgi:hypothetical protein